MVHKYLVQNTSTGQLKIIVSEDVKEIGSTFTVKEFHKSGGEPYLVEYVVKGAVDGDNNISGKQARLSLCSSGQWRNSDKVEMFSDDDVEGIRIAVEYLQQFFDLAVTFDVTPTGKRKYNKHKGEVPNVNRKLR